MCRRQENIAKHKMSFRTTTRKNNYTFISLKFNHTLSKRLNISIIANSLKKIHPSTMYSATRKQQRQKTKANSPGCWLMILFKRTTICYSDDSIILALWPSIVSSYTVPLYLHPTVRTVRGKWKINFKTLIWFQSRIICYYYYQTLHSIFCKMFKLCCSVA